MKARPRFSRLLIPGFLLLVICGGGCSIYKSKGRDQFEARAPGQVQTEIGTAALEPATGLQPVSDDFSSCWIQNQDEPLWSTPAGSILQIRSLNDHKMAVCLETEQNG